MDQIKAAKAYLDIINQLFEIERKVAALREPNSLQRNINKLKDIMEHDMMALPDGGAQGFTWHNPLGEDYNITRTDCEASIAGESITDLQIAEVIKPIIRFRQGDLNVIVQKAVVVVNAKTKHS